MMKSSQSSLSSEMKRSLLAIPTAAFLVLMLPTMVFAATPVDVYQDMESGQGGAELTAAVMNASNHGAGKWTAQIGTMWVGASFARDLPGPVSVGGAVKTGTGSKRTWALNDKTTNTYVSCGLPAACSTITTACYFTPGITNYCYTNDDTIRFVGGGWGVMQMRNNDRKGPYLFAHACLGGNSGSDDFITDQAQQDLLGQPALRRRGGPLFYRGV